MIPALVETIVHWLGGVVAGIALVILIHGIWQGTRRGMIRRDGEGEGGAAPGRALDPEPAAEAEDDLAADREPEAGPHRTLRGGVPRPPELLEDPLLVGGGDPGPLVDHADLDAVFHRACGERDGFVGRRPAGRGAPPWARGLSPRGVNFLTGAFVQDISFAPSPGRIIRAGWPGAA